MILRFFKNFFCYFVGEFVLVLTVLTGMQPNDGLVTRLKRGVSKVMKKTKSSEKGSPVDEDPLEEDEAEKKRTVPHDKRQTKYYIAANNPEELETWVMALKAVDCLVPVKEGEEVSKGSMVCGIV